MLCVAATSGLAGTVVHAGTFVEALHSGTRASSVAADGPFLSPGEDGVQAGVYQQFSGCFAPHMLSVYFEIESNGLPSTWVVTLVHSLAQEPGSAAVEA